MILNDKYSVEAYMSEDPFGNITTKSGTMADDNPFRFSTKYFDDETELSYYGYRYYDASNGRWINRDPAKEKLGGINLYEYVRNDPISLFDLLGLAAGDPGSDIKFLTFRFYYENGGGFVEFDDTSAYTVGK